MTDEEKKEFLESITNEELLNEFDGAAVRARNPYEYAERNNMKVQEVYHDYKLIREEILRRMHK